MKLSYTKYGPLMSSSPLVLAEVPSTFGEALLMKYMMMSTTSKQEQIAILSSMIENAINTITRQIAFHVFEVKSHELRKQKELTAEDMQKIWIEISREQLGDAIYVGAEHANYWSYISHFVHHPFYVHSYAVADLTTYALLNVYNSNSFDNFESRYLDFITNITVKNYSTLMKDFGFDVYQEQYWQNGMNYIENLVNQLESLLNDVNGK
jgi:oligoendopeptidase F